MELIEPVHPARRKTGRPLSFSREAALEQAMLTFWRYGYEPTSIVDLTMAMGITAPSLYSAFGDKKHLFLEAAHLYAGDPEALAQSLAVAPTAYAAVRTMLSEAAIAFTGDLTPKGCLLASSTANGSAAAAEVQKAIADIRRSIETVLRARIERDVEDGTLPPDTAAPALAAFVIAVVQGMSTLARDGAARPVLLAIVEQALRAWPAR